MILPYLLLFLPMLVAAQRSQAIDKLDHAMLRSDESRNALNWIGEGFLNVVDALFSASKSRISIEDRKFKKFKLNKYVLPLIVGFILIKSILLPIALKALAVLSGKAVVLSLMSLILAAIIGLKKVAEKESHEHKHRRQDMYDYLSMQELEPYRFYKERRRKK